MNRKTLAITAALAACGPSRGDDVPEWAAERYADALCAAYEQCGCEGMAMWSHPTGDTCRTETAATFRRVESWEGAFSLDCFERLLEWIPTAGCTTDGWKFFEGFPDCWSFSGRLERGEQCDPEWDGGYGQLLGQACSGNSVCIGTCAAPNQIARVGEGERCNDREVRCLTTASPRGEVDLYCSPEGRCVRQLGLGEPCTTPRACADDLYCAGLTTPGTEGVCEPRLAEGATCEPESPIDGCSPGLVGFCSRGGVCMTEMPKICESVTGNLQVFEHLPFVPADFAE